MPRLSPARAAARRQQITDAALRCFAERGFHKVTMQDVVRASGLSPGSIYSHFSSKEEIVYAAVEARHRRDLQSLEFALNAASLDDARALLAAAFFPSPARPEDRAWRRVAVQLWAESHHDATLMAAVLDGFDRPRQILTDLLLKARCAPRAGARAGTGGYSAGVDSGISGTHAAADMGRARGHRRVCTRYSIASARPA